MRPFKAKVTNPGDYNIVFSGLNPGTHIFDFKIGEKFFEGIEDTDIIGGDVSVNVTMIRDERMMDMHFVFDGFVIVPCDRCLEPIEMEVGGSERLIVKLGDRYFEESEDVQIIPETDHQIDLRPFMYEYIYLSLPARRVHEEDENGESLCDPEVIKKLEELTHHTAPDPRWEVLKNLKEENN